MSAAATSGSRGVKLGAEPRKLAILGVLVVVAVVAVMYNSNSSTSTPSGTTAVSPATNTARTTTAPHQRARRRPSQRPNDRRTLRMQEVTLEAQQGAIDPTLRLDLLERLKNAKFTAATRSLFEPGPTELPPQLAKKVTVMPGPRPEQTPTGAAAGPAGAPPPPPITLKFYGFAAPATSTGTRRGFFLDQEDVVIANEGETVKGRYHIVSLNPKSADVEDVATKNRQTLAITPEGQAGAY
jgi:hypothetical protein